LVLSLLAAPCAASSLSPTGASAGQAIRHGMIPVTANLAWFDRVLRLENWAAPRPELT
jgi:hypothetical protein